MSHTTESHRQVHVPRIGMVNVPNAVAERIEELEEIKLIANAMMPLFQDARDAITALSVNQCKLHHISLDLADRMDDVGIPERWQATRAAAEAAAKEGAG